MTAKSIKFTTIIESTELVWEENGPIFYPNAQPDNQFKPLLTSQLIILCCTKTRLISKDSVAK